DHGYGHLLAHGEEELRLVREMPVDRPPRDAGRGGDLFEGRAGHSLAGENLSRRGQDALPGALGFPFGSTHAADAASSLTYIRDCILQCVARLNLDEKRSPHGLRSRPA